MNNCFEDIYLIFDEAHLNDDLSARFYQNEEHTVLMSTHIILDVVKIIEGATLEDIALVIGKGVSK